MKGRLRCAILNLLFSTDAIRLTKDTRIVLAQHLSTKGREICIRYSSFDLHVLLSLYVLVDIIWIVTWYSPILIYAYPVKQTRPNVFHIVSQGKMYNLQAEGIYIWMRILFWEITHSKVDSCDIQDRERDGVREGEVGEKEKWMRRRGGWEGEVRRRRYLMCFYQFFFFRRFSQMRRTCIAGSRSSTKHY